MRVPGDRSITVRAVLLGSVADGTGIIRNGLDCDDTNAAIDIMRALGVAIHAAGAALCVEGTGLHGLRPAGAPLFCNASGTTMRLLAGLLVGQAFASALDGSAQLRRRPMRRITEPLELMGAAIRSTGDGAPLYIEPGALHGIEYAMPVASAQVKSALLLAGLYADGALVVRESAPTRDHTERMLAAMGVEITASDLVVTMRPPHHLRPLDISVPADFSSAAFFLVAGVLHPRARIELGGVGLNPTRTGLLQALNAMGADIRIQNTTTQGGEPAGDLLPAPGELRGIEVAGDLVPLMIDEFPIFAVAATQARGTTVVRDAQELRVKESNRIDGLAAELRKMGARIESTADGFVVEGPTPLRGAAVDACGDHRMAMALTVAGLIAQGETTIVGAECVSKTYPTFYADLARVTANHA